MKNYYDILDISPTASQDEIKKEYHFLIQALHPDKFRNPEQKDKAQERTKELNEAYSILSNPIKRAQYDKERLSSPSSSQKEAEEEMYSEETNEDIFTEETVNQPYEEDKAEEEMRSASNAQQQSVNPESNNQKQENVQHSEGNSFEYESHELSDKKFTRYILTVSLAFLATFLVGAYYAVITNDQNNLLILGIIVSITIFAAFLFRPRQVKAR